MVITEKGPKKLMKNNQTDPTKPVTIFQVASAAGVSYGTVSRVINGDSHVKAETRERVLAVMQSLGYVVDRKARSLASGRSRVIAVTVPDLGTGYIGEVMRGIDVELSQAGYDMMLYTTHRRELTEQSFIATIAQGMAEGALMVLPRNPASYLESVRARNFPFVLIDHQGINDQGPAVGATNWQGAFNATEYLIQLGHKRIGFITGWMDLGCARDRLDGYKAALRTHHIRTDASLIFEGDFSQPDGYKGGNTLLDLPNPPTAIFASNDVMAMSVIDAVREHGLRCPEDISVMGFDDIPQAAYTHPALTTIRQPLEKMGRVATQMLLDLLKDPDAQMRRIELPTDLIVRDSCGVSPA
jgi:LacI family transcriptional regulator